VWPANNEQAGMANSADIDGKYVEAITVNGGSITVDYGNTANAALANGAVTLQPGASAGGDVIWRCGKSAAPAQWVASSQGTVDSNTGTTVLGKYLPSNCRT